MKLQIESMAYGFDAVSHDEQGKTVFVSGGVPGDVVEAHVVSDGKSFSRAVVDEVLDASPDRVIPPCPYASICGGCPWSCMSYSAQVAAKRKNVTDTLVHIAHLDPDVVESLVAPVVESPAQWGYRNKVELGIVQDGSGISLGMHTRAGDGVVKVDRCLLLQKPYQRLTRAVSGALRFMGGSRELGLERVGIRASERTKEVEIALWTDPAAFPRNEVAKVLTDATKATSIARVLVKEGGAARKISRVERLAGKGHWEEQVMGRRMCLSAPSFFQVNTPAAEELIRLALGGLELGSQTLAADLYCGAGTFTIPMAKACEAVIAIESSGPAVRDLKKNVVDHHLDDKVECIGDDAARQLDVLEEVDAILVDPPRAGLDRSVIEAISDSGAEHVAYVSCDPATLARDLSVFIELGQLRPQRITPVDLFPQTFHVETVVLMTKE